MRWLTVLTLAALGVLAWLVVHFLSQGEPAIDSGQPDSGENGETEAARPSDDLAVPLDARAVVDAAPEFHLIRLRVIDRETRAPVEGASVWSIQLVARRPPSAEAGAWQYASERSNWIVENGSPSRTQANGEVVIDAGPGNLAVFARHGDRRGYGTFAPVADTVEIALGRAVPMLVRVVDAAGLAVPGVPLVLDAEEVSDSGLTTKSRTGADGVADFGDALSWSDLGAIPSLWLDFAFPKADSTGRWLYQSDRTGPAQDLILPPTGSLLVTVRRSGQLARDIQGVARVNLAHDGSGLRRLSAMIVGGQAHFPYVGLGIDLQVEVEIRNEAAVHQQLIAGPSGAGETMEVFVELSEAR